MSEHELRKQILVERVQANRELLAVELRTVRKSVSSMQRAVKVGANVLPQLGSVAATTAGAVGARKAGLGAAGGLAALVPVVIAVAKLAASWNRKRKADDEAAADGDSETPAGDDVSADS